MKDLFGQAIFDFYTQNNPHNIITSTNISDADIMKTKYLFRTYKQMPKIEQMALDLAYGKVLDVGCGAGCHSLYLQKTKLIDVTAIDISEKAIETCKLQGIKKAFVKSVLEYSENEVFDTILLLMNGTGIFGKLENVEKHFLKLKTLLAQKGQILIDSTDIIYMFDEDENRLDILNNENYYGELVFNIKYKNQTEEPFNWLYLDFERLKTIVNSIGMNIELLVEGKNYDYLAKITN